MSLDLTTLLAPVPGDSPGGVDLDARGAVGALEKLTLGKPESQFSDAVPADWRKVREEAEKLLIESKDVRPAVILAAALLKTEGLTGFCSGLELIAGLLRQYWAELYPKLDASEGNNPIDRVNALANLSAPFRAYGEPLQVALSLREAPLLQIPKIGVVTGAMLLAARGLAEPLPQQAPLDAAMADAALRTATPEKCAEKIKLIETALAHVRAIDAVFQDKAPSRGPDLSSLEKELSSLRLVLAPFSTTGAPAAIAVAGEVSAGASHPGGPEVFEARGELKTPEHVIRALDEICRYYAIHQPASPLPLLLQRVRRLVKADFLAIIEELAPDSVQQFKSVTGFKEPPVES